MKLIIEIPCKDGLEMEAKFNKAIQDFEIALKKKGFSPMELTAHSEDESNLIYKITLE